MFEQEIEVYQNYNKVMKTYLTKKKFLCNKLSIMT